MNKAILVGRLARDPELRTTGTGKSVTNITVAVDRRVAKDSNQQTADFINCVAWNKQAEVISQYLHKGEQIALEGRIQVSSYDDRDGNKRYKTEVMIDSFDFIGSRREEGHSSNDDPIPQQLADAPVKGNQMGMPLEGDDDFFLMADDSSVPF